MPKLKSNWNFAITVNCENADAAFVSEFWHRFELMFVLLMYCTLALFPTQTHLLRYNTRSASLKNTSREVKEAHVDF